jgi:predicted amino acid racemase
VIGPRLEIRLDRIAENARELVERLRARDIDVCGVTKATLGSPEISRVLLAAGVTWLGDSRIENIENLRRAGITAPLMLIRGPMMSQCDRVVANADVSLNSEIDVITALSRSAQQQGRNHGIVLMIELGDLREGIMTADLPGIARRVLELPGLELRGIGTNLACQSGVVPDGTNMGELSSLARDLEQTLDLSLDIISGGNSANLGWALDTTNEIGRVDQLRLGESILLGRDPLDRSPIHGLHTDAFTLVGEIIESTMKPARPWGTVGETAFGPAVDRTATSGPIHQIIVALGEQDTDPSGLTAPSGFRILGASSDHLILDATVAGTRAGDELRFDLGYSALLRAMTSPFVARNLLTHAP